MNPRKEHVKEIRKRGWSYLIFGVAAICILTVLSVLASPTTMSESQARRSCARAVEGEISGEYQWSEIRQSEVFHTVERTSEGMIKLSGDRLHILDRFGMWTQAEYSCRYETQTGQLERVEVWPIERMLRISEFRNPW